MGNQERRQPHQPQPTGAPEAVVFSATTTEHIQEAVVGQPPIQNGTHFQGPVQAQQVQPRPPPKVIHPGDLDPAALELYAAVVAQDPSPQAQHLAAALRHLKYDNTMKGGFKKALSHRITIQDVLVVSGVVVAVVFLWEAVAFKADLPRFGLFDPSNPMKVTIKKM